MGWHAYRMHCGDDVSANHGSMEWVWNTQKNTVVWSEKLNINKGVCLNNRNGIINISVRGRK